MVRSDSFVIVNTIDNWEVAEVCDLAKHTVTLFFVDWIKKHLLFMKGSAMKYLDLAILAFENSSETNLDLFAQQHHRLGDGYRNQYRQLYQDAIKQLKHHRCFNS